MKISKPADSLYRSNPFAGLSFLRQIQLPAAKSPFVPFFLLSVSFTVILILLSRNNALARQLDAKVREVQRMVPKDTLEKNYMNKVRERTAFLTCTDGEAAYYRNTSLHEAKALALLSPAYPCPYSMAKNPSVKDMYDGGKWTCGLEELAERKASKSCVVYSFGSNSNDAFEKSVHAVAKNCDIHVFDPTSPPLTRWSYHSYGLSGEDGEIFLMGKKHPVKTLVTIMRELKHSHVDVLKIDIEESEWPVLEETDWADLCVGQLLVEVHDRVGARRLPYLIILFAHLEEAGFRLYSVEPVCSFCIGQYELGFVNVRWDPRNAKAPCVPGKKKVKKSAAE